MERPLNTVQYNPTYIRHCALFWKCKNYEEYVIACDMEGLTPILGKENFESMHNTIE